MHILVKFNAVVPSDLLYVLINILPISASGVFATPPSTFKLLRIFTVLLNRELPLMSRVNCGVTPTPNAPLHNVAPSAPPKYH